MFRLLNSVVACFYCVNVGMAFESKTPSSVLMVSAAAVADHSALTRLYFYSSEELNALGVIVNGTKVFSEKISTKLDHGYTAAYRTDKDFKVADLETIEVHAVSKSEVQWVVTLKPELTEAGAFLVLDSHFPVPSEIKFQRLGLNSAAAPVSSVISTNSTGSSYSTSSNSGAAQPATKQLSDRELYYGSPTIDPNTLAQARAQRMADTGSVGHLGGGVVQTSMGTLCEGSGMIGGRGTPNTCVSANGSQAIGDGIASGPYGTFRSRLYRGATVPSGGGNGNGSRGMMRRRR